MSNGQIVVDHLTKQYPKVRAVDDLSFTVEPGRVTGFLGPNGAGKTTTLRMLLNLVRPTQGTATIGGTRYADLPDPLLHVGAVLEASSAHKGRTGRNHLRVICAAAGFPLSRADEALELVGLTPAAKRKFKIVHLRNPSQAEVCSTSEPAAHSRQGDPTCSREPVRSRRIAAARSR